MSFLLENNLITTKFIELCYFIGHKHIDGLI